MPIHTHYASLHIQKSWNIERYMSRKMTILEHLHFDFFRNRWRFLPPELLLPSQALPQKNNDIQNRTAKNIRALSCKLDSLSCQPVKRELKLIICSELQLHL
jgi:hypothetical protein